MAPTTLRITWLLAIITLSSFCTLYAEDRPDPLRLGATVKPLTQQLELNVDPSKDEYSGRTRVELQFLSATNQFRFHASEIVLGSATLDDQPLELTAQSEIITAKTKDTVSPGRHTFQISF